MYSHFAVLWNGSGPSLPRSLPLSGESQVNLNFLKTICGVTLCIRHPESVSLWTDIMNSPPALVMVTGTPWTWTPLMLIVCTAWAAEESCDVFNAIIPPAGAIFARVLSFRPLAGVFLALAGGEVVVVTTEVVGVVVVDTESWSWIDCHSPDAVLKRIWGKKMTNGCLYFNWTAQCQRVFVLISCIPLKFHTAVFYVEMMQKQKNVNIFLLIKCWQKLSCKKCWQQ